MLRGRDLCYVGCGATCAVSVASLLLHPAGSHAGILIYTAGRAAAGGPWCGFFFGAAAVGKCLSSLRDAGGL